MLTKSFVLMTSRYAKRGYEEWEMYILRAPTNGYIYDFSLLYIYDFSLLYIYIALRDIMAYYI